MDSHFATDLLPQDGAAACKDRYFQASLVPVIDRGEPLVDLAGYGFKCVPVYFHNGWTDNPKLYARRAVAEKLAAIQARVLAPRGVRWLIWDAWRSRETQAAIYQHYWRDLSAKHPKASMDTLRELVEGFVTVPNRPDYAPPHTTGGSVDLGLWDDEKNMPMDLGADFDEFIPEAASDAYEAPGMDEGIRQWRRLMAKSLADVGFSGDASEYFHKDYGNQRWAVQVANPVALYGEIVGVRTGERGESVMQLAWQENEVARARRLAALTEGLDLAHPATEKAHLLTPPKLLALA